MAKKKAKKSQVIPIKSKKKSPKKKSKKSPEPKATINTACQHVEEYAVQLKGRAQEQKIRGAVVIEFGVDPKDGGIRQVGAVSGQEAAFAALLIQQMVMGNLTKAED
jgi:hypothetical protein